MSHMGTAAVEMEANFWMVYPNGERIPVRSTLLYYDDDPYAVHVLFYPTCSGPSELMTLLGVSTEAVPWVFARELLLHGLSHPTGMGDVRVWPRDEPRDDLVALALSSPRGNALFDVPRPILVHFLHRTYKVVPRGHELDHIDIDTAFDHLLARPQAPSSTRRKLHGRHNRPDHRIQRSGPAARTAASRRPPTHHR